MKVLFVAQHRPMRSPSQRFRFEQYLDALSENGIEWEFSYLLDAKDDKLLYTPGKIGAKARILFQSFAKRKRDLQQLDQYDVVFVQREAFMTGSTFFETAVAKSEAALVFDFDDSIWLQNVSAANRYLNFLKNPEKTSKIIAMSDAVVAGNEYLADYARQFNQNVRIIPTTIDTEKYRRVPQPQSEVITIGWSGSITTIQHFEFALPFLADLKKKYGKKLAIKVIGDPNYRNLPLGIEGIAWTEASEIEELSTFDIGIMPLPDDEWAKGKCGLKGLQYMALSIPTIMSPVGVNASIIDHDRNGMLADTTEDWIASIESLIADREKRLEMGAAGRQTVVDHYSVQAMTPAYLDLFHSLA